MSSRIEYLKSIPTLETEDIAAYRVLAEREYKNITDKEEFFRKSHFLHHFAKEIPTIVDKEELIIGSMRFWHARVGERQKKIRKTIVT